MYKIEETCIEEICVDIEKAIMSALWCIKCEEKEYAYYIYNGMSLCDECFKKVKE